MGFKCGIVGLPNVGKSTLFNALTLTAAARADNYPFCTIDPNIGDVAVPDPRLAALAACAGSRRVVPARLTFVDIAGLVRGAAAGEGLGNTFLAHIREVDAIACVLRCFDDDDIAHVEGRVDPLADADTVETELMLADLESLEKRLPGLEKKARTGDKEARLTASLIAPAVELLREGTPARMASIPEEHQKVWSQLGLLTAKPVVYVCNVEEDAAGVGNDHSRRVADMAAARDAPVVVISARIESELADLSADERTAYLTSMGLEETGLDRLVRAGYRLLSLITYFTAGPKEARAWTIPAGATAPVAAGVIHTDFSRGFIRAETISCEGFIACGGEVAAREAGKMRLEGKDYIVQDGDVMNFRFSV